MFRVSQLPTIKRNGAIAVTNNLAPLVRERIALQREITALKEKEKTAAGPELVRITKDLARLHYELANLL